MLQGNSPSIPLRCCCWFFSDLGTHNVETSLIFSPKSFLPTSASANVTMYVNGRAYNILEVSLTFVRTNTYW